MATSKTKTEITFQENLNKITDTLNPFPVSALYALSNLIPENQAKFEAAWNKLDVVRRRKVAGSLNDLAEELIELNFDTVFYFLIKDSDAEVRGWAVDGLAEDESRKALGSLIDLLQNDPSEEVREKAAAGLSRFAYQAEIGRLPQRWVDRLKETLFSQLKLESNSVQIQRRLVEALGYFSDDEITRIIEKAYQNEDELLVAGALRAMGRNMKQRWLPEIGKELSNSSPLVRFEAATAVGELGSEELVPSLLKLLDDPDREVQLAVIWALGQVGGGEPARILKSLLNNNSSAIREAAQNALDELNESLHPYNPLA